MRNEYKILVEKHERKRSLGRHRRRWEDNIRKDLREIGLKDVDGMHLAQDRDQVHTLVNTVIDFRVL
jgi:hypothetical protein